MYVSFQSREDSLGMELITALESYCKRRNLHNFELYQRFSKEKINPGRWDNAFIEQELKKGNPNEIKKVFVCGPPVMNETFDRALTMHVGDPKASMINQLIFSREQIEIL